MKRSRAPSTDNSSQPPTKKRKTSAVVYADILIIKPLEEAQKQGEDSAAMAVIKVYFNDNDVEKILKFKKNVGARTATSKEGFSLREKIRWAITKGIKGLFTKSQDPIKKKIAKIYKALQDDCPEFKEILRINYSPKKKKQRDSKKNQTRKKSLKKNPKKTQKKPFLQPLQLNLKHFRKKTFI